MSKSVPWDIAFSLDYNTALAYCIILGEQDGGEWDWGNMRWRKRDA